MDTQMKTDVITIVHNAGEEKPWHLSYNDVSMFKTARAAINYPVQKFETEEKALEVATMLRDIIGASSIHNEETNEMFSNDDYSAEFFHYVEARHRERDEKLDFVELDDEDYEYELERTQEYDTLKALREEALDRLHHQADRVSLSPGESQREVEKEMGIDTEYTKADMLQAQRSIFPRIL